MVYITFLILLDIGLPGMTGFETLDKLKSKEKYYHIPKVNKMWILHEISVFEIRDEKNNLIIATGLNKNQAQAIIQNHNDVISALKWNKDSKQAVNNKP